MIEDVETSYSLVAVLIVDSGKKLDGGRGMGVMKGWWELNDKKKN